MKKRRSFLFYFTIALPVVFALGILKSALLPQQSTNAADFGVQGTIVRQENDRDCENTRGLSVSYADSIYESMLCAIRSPATTPAMGGSNACNGDNGGPLLAADYNTPRPDFDVGVQVGVVSWWVVACEQSVRDLCTFLNTRGF